MSYKNKEMERSLKEIYSVESLREAYIKSIKDLMARRPHKREFLQKLLDENERKYGRGDKPYDDDEIREG